MLDQPHNEGWHGWTRQGVEAARQTGGGAGHGFDNVTGDFLSSCFVSFADWICVCQIMDLSVTCSVLMLGRTGFYMMHLGDVRPLYIGSQTIWLLDLDVP